MNNTDMKEDDKSWRIEYLEPASVSHHEDNEEEEFKEKNESKKEDAESIQD